MDRMFRPMSKDGPSGRLVPKSYCTYSGLPEWRGWRVSKTCFEVYDHSYFLDGKRA